MSKILIINTGSQSKKYSLFEDDNKIYNAHFEKENDKFILTETFLDKKNKHNLSKRDYDHSIKFLLQSLIENNIIKEKKDIDIIGVRIVASGEYFKEHKKIDKEYLKKLYEAVDRTPLHLKGALEEIKKAKKIFINEVDIIGVSDSAYHKTIKEENKYYAIDMKDSLKYDIKRHGFHGISIESIINKLKNKENFLIEKIIVCHLGGGASITGVFEEKSVYNSMGFTPLDGLIMATRVGDIDPGAVLFLAKKMGLKKLDYYLNNNCGLLGISQQSNDIRVLLENEKMDDKGSTLALQMYADKVSTYILQAMYTLKGFDKLVFSGTVGERSFIMRNRICKNLEFLGIKIDKELNDSLDDKEGVISTEESKIKVEIIKTDETGAMLDVIRGGFV